MRTSVLFPFIDLIKTKNALVLWAQQFEEVVWLDSNEHKDEYGSFEAVLAVDAHSSLKCPAEGAFDRLRDYRSETKDWIFGYLSYDLKNDLEALSSDNHDGLDLPDLYFFQPRKIIKITEKNIEFSYLNAYSWSITDDYETIFNKDLKLLSASEGGKLKRPNYRVKMRIFKEEYFKRAKRLLDHIYRGDIYEANLCQEFYAEDAKIEPLKVYRRLNEISQAPFTVFLRLGSFYLISASPERYLAKKGNKVISQPIKGTAKREVDSELDAQLAEQLCKDPKERAENIMIVDLVRNDLSKSAEKGSVRVASLCELKSYKQVHQLLSTVTARVPTEIDSVKLIEETFPMGSMTGAPKVSAMKRIETLESFKRGLYSGAVGYFSPTGDFDFNVVIRSIIYNEAARYVSFSVGSAITSKSIIEKEYEECLLKAKAMRQVLEGE